MTADPRSHRSVLPAALLLALWCAVPLAAVDQTVDNTTISGTQVIPSSGIVDNLYLGGTSLVIQTGAVVTAQARQSVVLRPGTVIQQGASVTIHIGDEPPTANPQSVNAVEDVAQSITLTGSDPNLSPITFEIVTSPSLGTLSGTGANRTYTPSTNANGSDSFTFRVSDGVNWSSPATVSITVAAVNDAPSFTKGSDRTVADNAGAQSISGWATGISAGPANESAQTLTFTCSGYDAALFSVVPAVSATGTLTFTPAAGMAGTTTVAIRLQDNGGTANGGQDQSAVQSFAITITDSVWASLPAHTVYVVASETVYPSETTDPNASDRLTTTYAYTWHAGTNQIAQTTTTLPAVTTGSNGPGSASTTVQTFDVQGRPIWSKDADGYLHYRSYDPFTGAVVVSITDVDTTKSTDFTIAVPSGWSTPTTAQNPVAGGQHLKTQIEVDHLGRPVKITDPKNQVTYTVYNDAAHEVRVYPGWTGSAPTGPIRVAREHWGRNYREVLTMSTTPALSGNRPTGAEAIESIQSLRRELLDDNGRVQHADTYVDLSGQTYTTTSATLGSQRTATNLGGHYERTTYAYAARGFPQRVTRPDGTIEHTITDFLGRPTAQWKGTNVGSWTEATTTDSTTFKLVADFTYDGGNPGLGLLTTQRTYGDDASVATNRVTYTTQHRYDGRGRRIRSLGPDGVLAVSTLDNLGRATQTDTYAGIDITAIDTPASTARRGRSTAAYDALGRAWLGTVYEVDPATGTPTDALATQRWFDRRGNLLKTQTGSSAFTKTMYDGVGRGIETWVGSDGTEDWAAARTATNDTVAERTRTYRDPASNVVGTVRSLRRDTATATGPLAYADSHLSVQVAWYDAANRPVASADYGRDDGSTRYVINISGGLIADTSGFMPYLATQTPPTVNSSDDYRVSLTTYDAAGRPFQGTDNLGRVSETTYDLAGRVVRTIANRVDGTVANGETATDQTTTYVVAVGGGVAEQRVWVATGSAVTQQTTRYLRGDAIDAARVTSTIYPDSTDTTSAGSDQVKVAYDRLGQVRSRTDQRGVVRAFAYDAAGRLLADRVTNSTLPSGVDGWALRLQYGYDELGRVASVQTLDTAGTLTISGGAVTAVSGGSVLNEVKRTWSAWGQIATVAQAHAGAVGVGTPTVSYTWDDGGGSSGIARSLRLSSVSYPTSDHGFAVTYPASGLGAALDRADSITSGGQTIAQAEYLGIGTLARLTLPRANNARIERSSSAGNADGYSRYWQVASHAWATGGTQLDGWSFRHDRGGRITARLATWGTTRADRDDVTTYDGLDRMASLKRGQASATGVLADGATRRDWTWTLDQAGNWRTFGQDSNGGAVAGGTSSQARAHNQANEIDTTDAHGDAVGNSISGTGVDWIDPLYDAAGAMTTAPKPGTETTAQTLGWDAWGRLRTVVEGGSTVWTGSYDGQHRLIRWTAGGATKDAYLDEQSREVEVHSGGVIAEVYVWSLSGDRMLRMGTGSGSISSYYNVLTDNQGSVTALTTDGSSTVVERYRYDAYGVRIIYAVDAQGLIPLDANYLPEASAVRASSAYGMRYGFTGRPFDSVTGLGYYRARWYHASLGRFVSRDPAGYVDGGSMYQYVRGNSLWWVDPMGLGAMTFDALSTADQLQALGLISDAATAESEASAYGSDAVRLLDRFNQRRNINFDEQYVIDGFYSKRGDFKPVDPSFEKIDVLSPEYQAMLATIDEAQRALEVVSPTGHAQGEMARQQDERARIEAFVNLNGTLPIFAGKGTPGDQWGRNRLVNRVRATLGIYTDTYLAAHGGSDGTTMRVPRWQRQIATSEDGYQTSQGAIIGSIDGTRSHSGRTLRPGQVVLDLLLQPLDNDDIGVGYCQRRGIPVITLPRAMRLSEAYNSGLIDEGTLLALPCLGEKRY